MRFLKLIALSAAGLMLAACGAQAAPSESGTTAPTTVDTTPTYPAPDKRIALTFDDGPSVTTMVEVLDILKEHDVKATFFIVGKKINGSTEKVLKRAIEDSHEIGHHGMNHVHMNELSEEEVLKDIADCQEKVKEVTGVDMYYFRPPFGKVNARMHELIQMPFVTASITCGDGTVGSLAADRAYRVTSAAYDNAIVLMHCFEGNSETVEALKTVIPELKMQGYEFVTLTELFTYDGGEVPQPGTGNIVLDKNKVK